MNTQTKRLENNTVELTITIPWDTIRATYENVVEQLVKDAELPGFRKGKAPRAAVEEKLDKNKTYEEVLQQIIPKVYADAITQEKIAPIVMPKITLKEAKENEAWTIIATTCEKPNLELGDYKKAISDLKASKQQKIWVPGQEQKKEEEKDKKPTLDELLTAIYGSVKAHLPQILIDEEVNRLLSDLVDQTKKLGLTVDQYLASTNRSAESLRNDYGEQAKRTLTLEFALEEIANKEGITVTDEDINAVINTAKTEEEKKALSNQRYYLASILRRQKTIDFLAQS